MSKTKQTDPIADAEQTLATLQARRNACVQAGTELADERANVALAAHTGNAKARKRLDEINAAIATHASELASFDAAIKAAGERLHQAQAAEARDQDKVAAEALREVVSKIGERMRKADKYFAAAIGELNAANAELDQVHALGSAFPSKQQLAVNAIMALKTWLRNLPEHWHREFIEALPPNQRRTFAAFWERMQGPLESSIAARLGEPQQDEVAA
jgi:hypothetical protein